MTYHLIIRFASALALFAAGTANAQTSISTWEGGGYKMSVLSCERNATASVACKLNFMNQDNADIRIRGICYYTYIVSNDGQQKKCQSLIFSSEDAVQGINIPILVQFSGVSSSVNMIAKLHIPFCLGSSIMCDNEDGVVFRNIALK